MFNLFDTHHGTEFMGDMRTVFQLVLFACLAAPLARGQERCARLEVFVELPKPIDGCDGFGHSGIAINGRYYDYGPRYFSYIEGLVGMTGGPFIAQEQRSPRAVLRSRDAVRYFRAQPCSSWMATADVTPAQAQNVEVFWERIYEHPGLYRWFGKQCTTLVHRSLRQVGVAFGTPVIFPTSLLKRLHQLRHTCGPRRGRLVTVVPL